MFLDYFIKKLHFLQKSFPLEIVLTNTVYKTRRTRTFLLQPTTHMDELQGLNYNISCLP